MRMAGITKLKISLSGGTLLYYDNLNRSLYVASVADRLVRSSVASRLAFVMKHERGNPLLAEDVPEDPRIAYRGTLGGTPPRKVYVSRVREASKRRSIRYKSLG